MRSQNLIIFLKITPKENYIRLLRAFCYLYSVRQSLLIFCYFKTISVIPINTAFMSDAPLELSQWHYLRIYLYWKYLEVEFLNSILIYTYLFSLWTFKTSSLQVSNRNTFRAFKLWKNIWNVAKREKKKNIRWPKILAQSPKWVVLHLPSSESYYFFQCFIWGRFEENNSLMSWQLLKIYNSSKKKKKHVGDTTWASLKSNYCFQSLHQHFQIVFSYSTHWQIIYYSSITWPYKQFFWQIIYWIGVLILE